MTNRTFIVKDNSVWLDEPMPKKDKLRYITFKDYEILIDKWLNRESHPIEGEHDWKEGDIKVENVDFVLRYDSDWENKWIAFPIKEATDTGIYLTVAYWGELTEDEIAVKICNALTGGTVVIGKDKSHIKEATEESLNDGSTNFHQVIPDSHFWQSIKMLLNYCNYQSTAINREYLIKGLENTLNNGYDIILKAQSSIENKEVEDWQEFLKIMLDTHKEFLPNDNIASHEQSDLYMYMAKRIANFKNNNV